MRRKTKPILRMTAILAAIAAVGLGIYVAPVPTLPPKAEPKPENAIATSLTVKQTEPPQLLTDESKEFDRLFQESLAHMRAGRAHEALLALEGARNLRPHQPEVLVNMGFIYLAGGHSEVARELFQQVVTLRPEQMNAYYGLGLALKETGDLEGAVGAMRSFVHLSAPSNPFLRKAGAAVWEWEAELAASRPEPTPVAPAAEAPAQ